jgi:hypothetical protein
MTGGKRPRAGRRAIRIDLAALENVCGLQCTDGRWTQLRRDRRGTKEGVGMSRTATAAAFTVNKHGGFARFWRETPCASARSRKGDES